MPSAVLWFATDMFVDSDEQRGQRVNEDIGGAALAKWLSSELQAKGLRASAPWPEDHGWEFDVREGSDTYLLVATIEDEQDGTGKPASRFIRVSRAAPPLILPTLF
jgi:hypothetical protein